MLTSNRNGLINLTNFNLLFLFATLFCVAIFVLFKMPYVMDASGLFIAFVLVMAYLSRLARFYQADRRK
ncbi:MAG: hypothetical protein AAF705_22515 [Bacteroidota bacterium]